MLKRLQDSKWLITRVCGILGKSQRRSVWEARKFPTEFELLDKEDPYSYYRGQVERLSRLFFDEMLAIFSWFFMVVISGLWMILCATEREVRQYEPRRKYRQSYSHSFPDYSKKKKWMFCCFLWLNKRNNIDVYVLHCYFTTSTHRLICPLWRRRFYPALALLTTGAKSSSRKYRRSLRASIHRPTGPALGERRLDAIYDTEEGCKPHLNMNIYNHDIHIAH